MQVLSADWPDKKQATTYAYEFTVCSPRVPGIRQLSRCGSLGVQRSVKVFRAAAETSAM